MGSATRGMSNGDWMTLFPNVRIQHLLYFYSDHCPLLIHIEQEKREGRRARLWFEALWTLDESIEGKVKHLWNSTLGNIYDKLE
ncbi:reverse transcriptase [Gossypium australe]|uniref:Reverse transcriptase n=1 Tax=Gossypium australe TaxID=47621 RepID=A0A5B6UWY4_9ROSI|nr:reverse transcriptase [Gossypium australe]